MKRVNILLSTYNGERYIEQQINSLIKQDYPACYIFIRDDGSTDGTCACLKRYENMDKISIIYGKNLGFLHSFKTLLSNACEGDYWAFCDQDDIWYRDKVSRAVQWMDSCSNGIPLLYQCSYYLTDEQMMKIGICRPVIMKYDFRRGITENIFSGFSSMINDELRIKMLRGDWEKIQYHDCWMTLIALGFGKCYFDEYVGAEHRRLSNSVSEEKLGKRIAWGIQSMLKTSPLKMRNQEFYSEFYSELGIERRREIAMFAESGIANQIKKAFYPKRWRSKLGSELVLRGLMLLNKI